jgi:glycogen operon protein
VVLRLIMDCLRYWVTEMHVDGFRFSQATALGRSLDDFDQLSSFFALMAQDPVVSRVKLIAQPWDSGPNGFQLANFPAQWSEWNDRVREGIRDFWRGLGHPNALADHMNASPGLFRNHGRPPRASVGHVADHDGFTVRDLVSYNDKHNEANGEDNRDGALLNRSWNCGVEGPTDDPAILAVRARQQRNLLATVLLSQGMPMVGHGDELGRTQNGNNNAYCQDNEISWVDWSNVDDELSEFVGRVIRFRKAHQIFRRRAYPTEDVVWFGPNGRPYNDAEPDTSGQALVMLLDGDAMRDRTARGEPVRDDSFLVICHAGSEEIRRVLPDRRYGSSWQVEFHTAEESTFDGQRIGASQRILLPPHFLMVLRRV